MQVGAPLLCGELSLRFSTFGVQSEAFGLLGISFVVAVVDGGVEEIIFVHFPIFKVLKFINFALIVELGVFLVEGNVLYFGLD